MASLREDFNQVADVLVNIDAVVAMNADQRDEYIRLVDTFEILKQGTALPEEDVEKQLNTIKEKMQHLIEAVSPER